MKQYDINATAQSRQLSHMLAMQNRANAATNPHWFGAGYRWTRAIMVETVELMEHFNNWKWWKKRSNPALYQSKLEQVDSWHFALSWFMERFDTAESTDWVLNQAIMRRVEAAIAAATARGQLTNEEFHEAIEDQVASAAQGIFDVNAFFLINHHLGMDFNELYQMYVGKNVLNVFRQKAGYKTGTYRKDWAGEEDNEVLERIQAKAPSDLSSEAYYSWLMAQLEDAYTAVCRNADYRVVQTDKGIMVVSLDEAKKAEVAYLYERDGQPLPVWATK